MSFFQQLEKDALNFVINFITNNAAPLEAELAPFVAEGEAAIVAEATKLNPILGAFLSEAVASLGANLPKYEGDAVAYILAILKAFEATL